MFVDAGAEVIKIEPETGDPMRTWSSSLAESEKDTAFFKFLNAGKLSVIGSAADPEIQQLIATADLVIETYPTKDKSREQLLNVLTSLSSSESMVLLSISPYGRTGPYANHPATEFTLQADSGSLSTRGLPSQPPVMAGGRITEYVGGTFAAVSALAAVQYARKSGHGEVIDFSLCEVMSIAGTAFADLMSSLWGRPDIPGKLRNVEAPSIEPTKDGWVGFATMSFQQFSDFCIMIGHPELLERKELHQAQGRSKHLTEWNELVHNWTRERTTDEIVELAALMRIPVAQVNNGRTVLKQEQLEARQVFVDHPGENFKQPRTPYLVNGETPFPLQSAPDSGEHNDCILSKEKKPTEPATPRSLPLEGIRILDATAWWAGPSATQMLAHLGAEVIHLEAIQRPDGSRMMGGMFAHEASWWEYSAMFLSVNSNKQGLTLNLADPEGLEICKKLIAECDVFIENYSPRVMEEFGLDWNTVHQLNPETIMVRMPAFGLDGPWKNHVGFAQTMEQVTGMAWLTGHVEDQPRIQRGPCDPMAGMNAAFAIMATLEEKATTGKGSLIECPMVEGALSAAAEQVIEYTAYGNLLERNGNRCPQAAPQGLYYCHNHPTPDLPREQRRKPEQWLASTTETRHRQSGMGRP
jgi:crotonobetainyl-CoA:carnitine CoA-transferase CaiB-like acyl-CoA transferase